MATWLTLKDKKGNLLKKFKHLEVWKAVSKMPRWNGSKFATVGTAAEDLPTIMGRNRAKALVTSPGHVKGEAQSSSKNQDTLKAGIFALVDAAKSMAAPSSSSSGEAVVAQATSAEKIADLILKHQQVMASNPGLFGYGGQDMLKVLQKKYTDLIFGLKEAARPVAGLDEEVAQAPTSVPDSMGSMGPPPSRLSQLISSKGRTLRISMWMSMRKKKMPKNRKFRSSQAWQRRELKKIQTRTRTILRLDSLIPRPRKTMQTKKMKHSNLKRRTRSLPLQLVQARG